MVNIPYLPKRAEKALSNKWGKEEEEDETANNMKSPGSLQHGLPPSVSKNFQALDSLPSFNSYDISIIQFVHSIERIDCFLRSLPNLVKKVNILHPKYKKNQPLSYDYKRLDAGDPRILCSVPFANVAANLTGFSLNLNIDANELINELITNFEVTNVELDSLKKNLVTTKLNKAITHKDHDCFNVHYEQDSLNSSTNFKKNLSIIQGLQRLLLIVKTGYQREVQHIIQERVREDSHRLNHYKNQAFLRDIIDPIDLFNLSNFYTNLNSLSSFKENYDTNQKVIEFHFNSIPYLLRIVHINLKHIKKLITPYHTFLLKPSTENLIALPFAQYSVHRIYALFLKIFELYIILKRFNKLISSLDYKTFLHNNKNTFGTILINNDESCIKTFETYLKKFQYCFNDEIETLIFHPLKYYEKNHAKLAVSVDVLLKLIMKLMKNFKLIVNIYNVMKLFYNEYLILINEEVELEVLAVTNVQQRDKPKHKHKSSKSYSNANTTGAPKKKQQQQHQQQHQNPTHEGDGKNEPNFGSIGSPLSNIEAFSPAFNTYKQHSKSGSLVSESSQLSVASSYYDENPFAELAKEEGLGSKNNLVNAISRHMRQKSTGDKLVQTSLFKSPTDSTHSISRNMVMTASPIAIENSISFTPNNGVSSYQLNNGALNGEIRASGILHAVPAGEPKVETVLEQHKPEKVDRKVGAKAKKHKKAEQIDEDSEPEMSMMQLSTPTSTRSHEQIETSPIMTPKSAGLGISGFTPSKIGASPFKIKRRKSEKDKHVKKSDDATDDDSTLLAKFAGVDFIRKSKPTRLFKSYTGENNGSESSLATTGSATAAATTSAPMQSVDEPLKNEPMESHSKKVVTESRPGKSTSSGDADNFQESMKDASSTSNLNSIRSTSENDTALTDQDDSPTMETFKLEAEDIDPNHGNTFNILDSNLKAIVEKIANSSTSDLRILEKQLFPEQSKIERDENYDYKADLDSEVQEIQLNDKQSLEIENATDTDGDTTLKDQQYIQRIQETFNNIKTNKLAKMESSPVSSQAKTTSEPDNSYRSDESLRKIDRDARKSRVLSKVLDSSEYSAILNFLVSEDGIDTSFSSEAMRISEEAIEDEEDEDEEDAEPQQDLQQQSQPSQKNQKQEEQQQQPQQRKQQTKEDTLDVLLSPKETKKPSTALESLRADNEAQAQLDSAADLDAEDQSDVDESEFFSPILGSPDVKSQSSETITKRGSRGMDDADGKSHFDKLLKEIMVKRENVEREHMQRADINQMLSDDDIQMEDFLEKSSEITESIGSPQHEVFVDPLEEVIDSYESSRNSIILETDNEDENMANLQAMVTRGKFGMASTHSKTFSNAESDSSTVSSPSNRFINRLPRQQEDAEDECTNEMVESPEVSPNMDMESPPKVPTKKTVRFHENSFSSYEESPNSLKSKFKFMNSSRKYSSSSTFSRISKFSIAEPAEAVVFHRVAVEKIKIEDRPITNGKRGDDGELWMADDDSLDERTGIPTEGISRDVKEVKELKLGKFSKLRLKKLTIK